MNTGNNQEFMERIFGVLESLRKKRVRLWSENGRLHYRAPKGALTQEEIECLRNSRGQMVALLQDSESETTEPGFVSRPRLCRAPMAFSQLAHWHTYRLGERRAIRQIASATRLRGPLNVDALQRSVAEIVTRHDTLRTRIVVLDGIPVQEISEEGNSEIRMGDLSDLSESLREVEIARILEQHILEPIDVAVGPLFGLALLKLRDDEHVLIVVMEHIISDAFSMSILLRDLFTAYTHALDGNSVALPAIPIQFADYALRQKTAKKSWMEKHGAYWSQCAAGCPRVRFPEDRSSTADAPLGWEAVNFRIDQELKAELREWCRLKRTTLVMGVFTAYVAVVLRWCNASESMIRYQSDGRVSPDMENTIGFFASVLYLRIKLLESDSFIELMSRVTDEYCKAYECADFSCMAARVPRPEFTRNTAFNWIPQGSKVDFSSLERSQDAIECTPIRFKNPMLRTLELDIEPYVLLFDTEDGVVGEVHFPLNRFSVGAMERFGRNFLAFLNRLLRQPEVRLNDIVLL